MCADADEGGETLVTGLQMWKALVKVENALTQMEETFQWENC